MAYPLDKFKVQLKKDVEQLFKIDDADNFIKDYEEKCNEIFGDYRQTIEAQYNWLEEKFDKAREYGFDLHEPNKGMTALDCDSYVMHTDKLEIDDPVNATKYFFTATSGHWYITRHGKGVKSVLNNRDYKNQSWPENELTYFINKVNQFDPETNEAFDFYNKMISSENWDDYPDITVLFHLIWPQFYPVFYRTTQDGYSQIEGMINLFDDIEEELNITRIAGIDLNNYSYYSSAYRILLYGYHLYVHGNNIQPPHWDYFIQFLADIDMAAEVLKLVERKKAIILYGIPGTGKTHLALELSRKITNNDSNKYKIIQFHPNYNYQDFIIGIKPQSQSDNQVNYPVIPGHLYRACYEAALDRDHKYIMIIDEISRADLASVFGEVMFCLEYRERTVPLPQTLDDNSVENPFFNNGSSIKETKDIFNKGKAFFIPNNLYIIGTMNTVDKSVMGFDIALRRRFGWFKVDYKNSDIGRIIEKRVEDYEKKYDLQVGQIKIIGLEEYYQRCDDLNNSSGNNSLHQKLSLTDEHRIGQAYFAEIINILLQEIDISQNITGKIDLKISKRSLRQVWLYHIEPLLEEYLGYDYYNQTNQDALLELRKYFCKKLAINSS